MQSSNSGGLMSTHGFGECHDTLYAMTCKPVDLRPRLTLRVRASTIIFWCIVVGRQKRIPISKDRVEIEAPVSFFPAQC
jgi:hypothetical protein